MSETKPIAVVLLSGGLDSATTAAIALDQGFDLAALTIRYGQRHELELAAAKRIAQALGVARHIEQSIDLRAFGGSALTDDIDVPKAQTVEAISTGIPVTYVPARNTIFLAFALAFAETLGSTDIFIGVNAVDYSGYPDCRPEFIDAFTEMATAMFGWLIAAAARASCSKRASRSGSDANSAGSTLIATLRPSRVSSPR